MKFATSFSLLLSCAPLALGAVTWSVKPFNPPSIPLAVRTPYLSAWLPGGDNGGALNNAWPTFWTGKILGWAGYIRVDGVTYTFLGAPGNSGSQKATQTAFEFTSTQSNFILTAGPVNLLVGFLSPIEPTDYVKQSIPLSYMALTVKSNDGKAHTVQLYSDISGEWASGGTDQLVSWATSTDNGLLTHSIQRQSPSNFNEINDQTEYGAAYYSTPNTNGATYQTGSDTNVRGQFITNGKLANTKDTAFRAVQDNWPVLGIAHDLGSITNTVSPILYVVGHIRDPAIQYITAGNVIQNRSSFFWSKYTAVVPMIADFVADYARALQAGIDGDNKLAADANAISADYASIVALSARQALGSMELTVSKNADGSYNTADKLVFMKEISSDGNMNTVDVIFPAWPVLLYYNSELGRDLLEGLFRYQESGLYPNKWSVHDLGGSYPKALGHNDGNDEAMPVEESGNMLIMALSYAQKSGNNSFLSAHYPLLQQWTQFLIDDSLIPADQLSTDDFAGHLVNQTNLAVKGIIGIKSMALISGILGKTDDSTRYNNVVADYLPKWTKFATVTNGQHLNLQYNNDASWGLAYNLVADKLVKTGVFPASLFQLQTDWYKTVQHTYGVPLDTRHTYTKSDWMIWAAGLVSDTTSRNTFITSVKKYVSNGLNNIPFSDWYDTDSGQSVGFRARPVVGGHFMLLLLNDAGFDSADVQSDTNLPSLSAASTSSTLSFWVAFVAVALSALRTQL